MPATSRRQQRYLARKFGPDWLRRHHFDKLKKKPRKRDPRGEVKALLHELSK